MWWIMAGGASPNIRINQGFIYPGHPFSFKGLRNENRAGARKKKRATPVSPKPRGEQSLVLPVWVRVEREKHDFLGLL